MCFIWDGVIGYGMIEYIEWIEDGWLVGFLLQVVGWIWVVFVVWLLILFLLFSLCGQF